MTDPNCIEALQFLQDLNVVHKVIAPIPEGMPWDYPIQEFANGKYAMFAYHDWIKGTLSGSMADDYGVVLFPMGPKATEYASDLLAFPVQVMPNGIKNPKEVAIVYDEMTDPLPGIDPDEAWRESILGSYRDTEVLKTYEMLFDKGLAKVNKFCLFPLDWSIFSRIEKGEVTAAVAVQEYAQEAQSIIDDTMENAK